MPCVGDQETPSQLQWDRADHEFWTFLEGWIRRAARALNKEEHFEGLIYLWVAFNAWLGHTIEDRTLANRDRALIHTAGSDEQLSGSFEALLQRDGREADMCNCFHSFWPVFHARALVDRGLGPWQANQSRTEYRANCFRAQLGRADWAPRCFQMHQPDGTRPEEFDPRYVPLDWVHTLNAIYQVRCNLFHGGKSFRYSRDEEFVSLAARILWEVWKPTRAERAVNR